MVLASNGGVVAAVRDALKNGVSDRCRAGCITRGEAGEKGSARSRSGEGNGDAAWGGVRFLGLLSHRATDYESDVFCAALFQGFS